MRELTVAGGRRQARYAAEEAIDDGAGVHVRAVYCDRRLIP
jgi:hypothetical protein